MNDILDLPGWTVLAKRLDGTEYELEAEYAVQPTVCPKCGSLGKPYKHGTKNTTYRDSPIRGKTTRILARVQRYRCRDCGETFLQPLAGVLANRLMTERCAEFIGEQCLVDTFVRIAQNVGCDEKTVRTLAGECIAKLMETHKPALPTWLGIDETTIDGCLLLVLTDIKNRRPVDMLLDDSMGGLQMWLHRFKDRSHVEVVTTDMHRAYRTVVKALLPGVPVVVDKFHVVRMANTALDDVRTRLAKANPKPVGRAWMRRKALLRMRYKNLDEKGRFNLQMWLDNEPEFAVAYRLKEAFYDIYDAPTKDDARRMLEEWRASVPPLMRNTPKKEFKPLWTATKNWAEDILSYWDFPVTNAYTEAVNGVAKVINRAGRGYSFEVLRARWLFSKGIPEQAPPPLAELVLEEVRPAAPNHLEWHRARRLAFAANPDGICQSCGGVFGKELDLHRTLPLVPGEHVKYMLMCKPCHHRFHTAEVKVGHKHTP